MGGCATYIFWTKEELKEHLLRQCNHYDLTSEILLLMHEAVDSERWNPIDDFDGCTVVQDRHHPFLPCFIHDYMWVTGMGGKEADRLFYYLIKDCGLKTYKTKIWYLGVRIGWIVGYRYLHLKKRNVRPFSERTKKALDSYGISYTS